MSDQDWYGKDGRDGSGHQGEASQAAEPRRRAAVEPAYEAVREAGTAGLTWRELAQQWGPEAHHGVVSAALSNAHRQGRIVRLRDRRNRCGIYVANDPDTIAGRAVVPYRSNRRATPPSRAAVHAVVDDWLNGPGDTDLLTDRLMDLITGTLTTEGEHP